MAKPVDRAELQKLNDEYESLQRGLQNYISARQQLESQFQENRIVKEEFGQIKDDAKIYKLIGPVLVPQDKPEASSNVDKRLEFITSEMVEGQIASSQKSIEEKRSTMQTALQGQ